MTFGKVEEGFRQTVLVRFMLLFSCQADVSNSIFRFFVVSLVCVKWHEGSSHCVIWEYIVYMFNILILYVTRHGSLHTHHDFCSLVVLQVWLWFFRISRYTYKNVYHSKNFHLHSFSFLPCLVCIRICVSVCGINNRYYKIWKFNFPFLCILEVVGGAQVFLSFPHF